MRKLVFLLLLTSCNKACFWDLETTEGSTAEYCSYKIHSRDAIFAELSLEFMYFQDRWTGFINLPSSLFSKPEAELLIKSKSLQKQVKVPILSGNQRAFLSEALVLQILAVLTQEESVTLSLDGFEASFSREGLQALLEKIPTSNKK